MHIYILYIYIKEVQKKGGIAGLVKSFRRVDIILQIKYNFAKACVNLHRMTSVMICWHSP